MNPHDQQHLMETGSTLAVGLGLNIISSWMWEFTKLHAMYTKAWVKEKHKKIARAIIDSRK